MPGGMTLACAVEGWETGALTNGCAPRMIERSRPHRDQSTTAQHIGHAAGDCGQLARQTERRPLQVLDIGAMEEMI
jgi:hypothetical protein